MLENYVCAHSRILGWESPWPIGPIYFLKVQGKWSYQYQRTPLIFKNTYESTFLIDFHMSSLRINRDEYGGRNTSRY